MVSAFEQLELELGPGSVIVVWMGDCCCKLACSGAGWGEAGCNLGLSMYQEGGANC